MKKYAIAIYSNHEGDNKLFIIETGYQFEATAKVDVAKRAILEHCPPEYRTDDYIDWVRNLGNDFETIADGARQSELVLSEPICVFS